MFGIACRIPKYFRCGLTGRRVTFGVCCPPRTLPGVGTESKLLKEAGYLQYAHWNAALEGWAMWLLTHFGEPEPWTKEEVQVFLAQVRAELKDPTIHAYEPA